MYLTEKEKIAKIKTKSMELGVELKLHPVHKRYVASSVGHIYCFNKRGELAKKKLFENHHATYLFVCITIEDDGITRQTTKSVSRLILECFKGFRERPWECNHLDGDHKNNDISNLEWTTAKQNMAHAKYLGLRDNCHGEKHYKSLLTEAQVKEIRFLHNIHNITQSYLADKYKVSKNCIWKIVNRKSWNNV